MKTNRSPPDQPTDIESAVEALRAATFRIHLGQRVDPRMGGKFDFFGTGFFVDGGHALTARQLLDGCPPDALLRATYQGRTIRLRWQNQRASEAADIAVLQLEDNPEGVPVRPVPPAFLDLERCPQDRGAYLAGRSVVLFGFPETEEGALGWPIVGVVREHAPVIEVGTPGTAARAERLCICAPPNPKLEGVSGAPILDRATGRIIGIQVSYDVRGGHGDAGQIAWHGAGLLRGAEIAPLVGEHAALGSRLERMDLASAPRVCIAPTRLPRSTGRLFDRAPELARLDEAWKNSTSNILQIVAWGGAGKTSLVVAWITAQAAAGWPGFECVFDWCFYSLGTRELAVASADAFITSALEFFGDPAMAHSTASPWDKGARLAQLAGRHRALLVLDGIEPLQHPPGPLAGLVKDPAVAALLRGLAQQNAGLCIVTTRECIADLASFRDTTAPVLELPHMPSAAAVEMLRSLGVHGTSEDLRCLVEEVEGHALTLNLLGRYLARAFGGDSRRRDRVDWGIADVAVEGGRAFRVLAAYEKWLAGGGERGQRQLAVLRLLGFFNRPADPGCLAVLRAAPAIPGLSEALVSLSDAEWNLTVEELRQSGLVTATTWQPVRVKGYDRDQARALRQDLEAGEPREWMGPPSSRIAPELVLDAHRLVAEYFADQLRRQQPAAWEEGHRRILEHLAGSVPHWPEGLEGLVPLYRAVSHGCQARRHKEALRIYQERILRGTDGAERFYSTGKLGAIGADLVALNAFFSVPWKHVATEIIGDDRAWLWNDTGWHLFAAGRLQEALELYEAAITHHTATGNWRYATGVAINLSELHLTLGDVRRAEEYARLAVKLADVCDDKIQGYEYRAVLADVLHHQGRNSEADQWFREAERMEAVAHPRNPLLHSRQGWWFCELLLDEPERAAWRLQCGSSTAPGGTPQDPASLLERCVLVEQRATQTLGWDEPRVRAGLMAVALEHLSTGRALLYRAVIEASPAERAATLARARQEVQVAVEGLRQAGATPELPRSLLTRAWLQVLEGNPAGAQADLDQAWQLAELGAMRLHLADIHLYRARLFFRQAWYPWSKDDQGNPRGPQNDLAAARQIIEACGYSRRREELEDAERTILEADLDQTGYHVEMSLPAEMEPRAVVTLTLRIVAEERRCGAIAPEPMQRAAEQTVDVTVLARTNGADLTGSNLRRFPLPIASETMFLCFDVMGVREGTASVTVDLFHMGRYLCSLTTESRVKHGASTPPRLGVARSTFTLVGAWEDPDVLIRIYAKQGQWTETLYCFEVTSHKLGLLHSDMGVVGLPDRPEAWVEAQMSMLTQMGRTVCAGSDEVVARFGEGLFDKLCPPAMQELYWSRMHDREDIQTVLIISSEPWVPWEMLKPWRKTGEGIVEAPHWCERFVLGRWLNGKEPPMTVPRGQIAAIAPRDLDFDTEREVDLLEQAGKSVRRIEARWPAVLEFLQSDGCPGLHVISHGVFNRDDADQAALWLEMVEPPDEDSRDRLFPGMLSGRCLQFGKAHPLVFLNACNCARSAFKYWGLSGWASAFIVRAECSAFLAPFWEVEDERALKFAKVFYDGLLRGESIGEALRFARQATKQTCNPTWLAYCLYAHPRARLAVSPAPPGAVPQGSPA